MARGLQKQLGPDSDKCLDSLEWATLSNKVNGQNPLVFCSWFCLNSQEHLKGQSLSMHFGKFGWIKSQKFHHLLSRLKSPGILGSCISWLGNSWGTKDLQNIGLISYHWFLSWILSTPSGFIHSGVTAIVFKDCLPCLAASLLLTASVLWQSHYATAPACKVQRLVLCWSSRFHMP